MRKAISLFLAASVLCLATSAMAEVTSSSVSGTLNLSNGTTSTGTRNSVTTFGANESASMPCFRPGDVIIFTIQGLTAGEELTLITYKNGETPSDSTVQYINQYTVSGTTQDVSYTIRNLASASAIYKLEINGGTSGTKTFYYKVGDASVQVLDNDDMDGSNHGTFKSGEGDPYIIKKAGNGTWSVGFIGKVTVGNGVISLADIGANPGFSITNGSKTKKYGYGGDGQKAVSVLDATTKYEISGSYSLIYGLTMYNVTDGSQSSIKATAVLDADE